MSPSPLTELCRQPATEIRRRIWAREVSVVEMTEAHLQVIECANTRINAIVTLVAERALAEARAADAALLVQRLRRAGAITIDKTNTPEWGAGSNTTNPVFGPTRNPYDERLTPGGSSDRRRWRDAAVFGQLRGARDR